jgi:Acetyltransferases, including N-acetylases of ribosomal proteins
VSVTLRTERLVLREWREADRDAWAAMSADPEVMEFFPATLDRVAADAVFDRIAASLEERGWGLWAVEADGAFVGFTGLQPVPFEAAFTPAIEIGWRLARSAWGRGFATEAARASLDYAWRELALDEVVAMAVPANRRSLAVMRKLGMTHDPADDFDHPRLADGPLRRHMLFRVARRG